MSARDVIADHRIGYPGAPGGLLLGSVHADAILAALHDAGYAVVPVTDPVYTGGMNDLCVTIPHLSEREKALFVAALKGDAGPTTPPATDPAPAVCEWQPIETAPTDGTLICGAWMYGSRWATRVLYWNGHDWECPLSDGYYEPTHWMPLPPPESKE